MERELLLNLRLLQLSNKTVEDIHIENFCINLFVSSRFILLSEVCPILHIIIITSLTLCPEILQIFFKNNLASYQLTIHSNNLDENVSPHSDSQ